VLVEADLGEGEHRRVTAGETSVLLARDDGQLYASANTCSHAGGPLDEGELVDGCIVCPWHASTFRLADGTIRAWSSLDTSAQLPDPGPRRKDRSTVVGLSAA